MSRETQKRKTQNCLSHPAAVSSQLLSPAPPAPCSLAVSCSALGEEEKDVMLQTLQRSASPKSLAFSCCEQELKATLPGAAHGQRERWLVLNFCSVFQRLQPCQGEIHTCLAPGRTSLVCWYFFISDTCPDPAGQVCIHGLLSEGRRAAFRAGMIPCVLVPGIFNQTCNQKSRGRV